jgi:hypothetical protein
MLARNKVAIIALPSLLTVASAAMAQRRLASPPNVDLSVTAFELKSSAGGFFQAVQDASGAIGQAAAGAMGGAALPVSPGAKYEVRCRCKFETALSAEELAKAALPTWKIHFTVDGKTQGVRERAAVKIIGYIGGKPIVSPYTAPDAMFEWTAPSSLGEHTLGCILDPENKISEKNESNNQVSKQVKVVGPWIKGNLVVHPNTAVDPGYSELRFDANVAGIAKGSTWWLEVGVVSPSGLYGTGAGKKISEAGPVQDVVKPYKVACAAAKASQICFKLSAHTKAPGSVNADLGQVCLPVKSQTGPTQPELVVQHPAVVGPGAVLHFSAKIPRRYCEKGFRVARSPLESATWSTGSQQAHLGSPTVSFPETYQVTSSPVRPGGKPSHCFVLLMDSLTPVDKWCWEPPVKITGGPAEVAGLAPGGQAPAPANPVRGGGPRRGSITGQQPSAGSVAPALGAALGALKPDLTLSFGKGGGWGSKYPPHFWVRNEGKTDAGPSRLRFSKPGVAPTLVSVGPVSAQSYSEIKVTQELKLYAGGTVTADALNQVDEASEGNNVFQWSWNPFPD